MHTQDALERARLSLEGLSVGDSLGGFLEFGRSITNSYMLKNRVLPAPVWRYTDDTNMALSVYAILREHGTIDQEALAQSFGKYFDRTRGYGMGARSLLMKIQAGVGDWRVLAPQMFKGGSFGNGGAMRVAPVGAYFADRMDLVVENARLQAEITHAHPEGIAGAIAVAVGAAIASQVRGQEKPSRADFITNILPHVPDSEVKVGIRKAKEMQTVSSIEAAAILGNGVRVSAQDSVPYSIYNAAEYLDNFEEAFWQTASSGGDVDTTCAMVGGIVACYVGYEGIPQEWVKSREALPDWALGT